jgi:serine protease Do
MLNAAMGRVIEALRRSTVLVRSGKGRDVGNGSGVVLDGDRVITNAHVARTKILQIESWEGKCIQAQLTRSDPFRDLALLAAPGLNAPPAYLGDSGSLRVGEQVIAVGNPLGFTGAASVGSVKASPSESAVLLYGQRWLCTDVHLAPGNSGGPLADSKGQVIGINTMVISGGLSLAVPSNAVQSLLRRIKHPRSLGVTVRPVKLPAGRAGMLLLELARGGAAECASLLPGDVLLAGNGVQFELMEDFQSAIDHADGELLRIEFSRGGETKLRHVVVQLAPERVASAA